MKTHLGKVLSIFLVLTLLISVSSVPTFYAETVTSGDYDYTVLSDGTAEISKYNGTDADIEIPTELDGIEVTSIGERAFEMNKTIETLVISEGITNIGDHAFWQSSNLATITLPNSLTTLGNNSFSNLPKLEGISIPDGITEIPDNCFQSCDSATSLKLPSNLTSIGNMAFVGWQITTLDLPNTLTKIDQSAFSHCTQLTELVIPENVELIRGGAFSYCTSLTSISLPESLKEVQMGAFSTCTSLLEVTCPQTVKTIGRLAFGYWFDKEVWNDVLLEDFVLTGYTYSPAYYYAQENGIEFKSLGESTVFRIEDFSATQQNGYVQLETKVKNADGDVTYKYYANDKELESNHWIPENDGKYTLKCVATDGNAEEATSTISVYINKGVIGEPDPDAFQTVYFDNTKNNFSLPTCYYWSSKTNSGPVDWPGTQMELVSDNIYKVIIPTAYDMCIFSSKGSNQSSNLTIKGDGYIYDGTAWSDSVYEPVVKTNYSYGTLLTNCEEPSDLGSEFDSAKMNEDMANTEGYVVVVYKYKTKYSAAIYSSGQLQLTYDDHPYESWNGTTSSELLWWINNWNRDGFKVMYLKGDAVDPVLLGDANSDKIVDIHDSTSIQLYSAEVATLNTLAADVNEDGKVDIRDATLIQQFLAGTLTDTKINTYI